MYTVQIQKWPTKLDAKCTLATWNLRYTIWSIQHAVSLSFCAIVLHIEYASVHTYRRLRASIIGIVHVLPQIYTKTGLVCPIRLKINSNKRTETCPWYAQCATADIMTYDMFSVLITSQRSVDCRGYFTMDTLKTLRLDKKICLNIVVCLSAPISFKRFPSVLYIIKWRKLARRLLTSNNRARTCNAWPEDLRRGNGNWSGSSSCSLFDSLACFSFLALRRLLAPGSEEA